MSGIPHSRWTPFVLLVLSGVAWPQDACDVNRDGAVNLTDWRVAAGNALSCPTLAFQLFSWQVATGVWSTCPVTRGLHTVFLNWTASTTSGVTYTVYRANRPGGYDYQAPLAQALYQTSFTDCDVAPGQPYYYVVRAVDRVGHQSVNSTEVKVTLPSR